MCARDRGDGGCCVSEGVTPQLLHGGNVFDGRDFVGARDVLISDGVIADVDVGLSVGTDVEVVDCSGRTVMPGLIDAHVHLAWAGLDPPPADAAVSKARAVGNAARLLAAGITTVRDTGGPLEVLHAVRRDIAAGHVVGPDIVHCGRILCAPGGHGAEYPLPVPIAAECSGPGGFRAGVRSQLAGGALAIKVALNGASGRVELTIDELRAVVDEAHAAGVRVACHASVRDAVALAVDCGVDTIEHGNGLDDALAKEMARRGIGLVPTTAIFRELKDQFDADTSPPDDLRTAQRCAVDQRIAEHVTTMAAALNAGVTIGFGTDRVPGGDVVAIVPEAVTLQRYGLSITQVLRALTSINAQLLGLSDRGMIRAGARADIVVFDGELGSDLRTLASPHLVVTGHVQTGPYRCGARQRRQLPGG